MLLPSSPPACYRDCHGFQDCYFVFNDNDYVYEWSKPCYECDQWGQLHSTAWWSLHQWMLSLRSSLLVWSWQVWWCREADEMCPVHKVWGAMCGSVWLKDKSFRSLGFWPKVYLVPYKCLQIIRWQLVGLLLPSRLHYQQGALYWWVHQEGYKLLVVSHNLILGLLLPPWTGQDCTVHCSWWALYNWVYPGA